MPVRPVLHGDNGATPKATTFLAMLHWLGIEPSYSRPRVSDDNAFAEALFRTAKYRPEFPLKGFAELDAARQWAVRFVKWYKPRASPQRHPLRHRGAASCRAGWSRAHRSRHVIYQDARSRNPQRWSGQTRNWKPSAPSPSIRSATSSFGRQPYKSCFPVRSASLLSRPDLEAPTPGFVSLCAIG
jgi:putative transposase